MLISFETRDDDPAEDNVLTENKDQQRGNGGYHQRGHDQIVRIALLELIEKNHQRPHRRVLACEEREHECAVGVSERT